MVCGLLDCAIMYSCGLQDFHSPQDRICVLRWGLSEDPKQNRKKNFCGRHQMQVLQIKRELREKAFTSGCVVWLLNNVKTP
jgi:hypothetical protein